MESCLKFPFFVIGLDLNLLPTHPHSTIQPTTMHRVVCQRWSLAPTGMQGSFYSSTASSLSRTLRHASQLMPRACFSSTGSLLDKIDSHNNNHEQDQNEDIVDGWQRTIDGLPDYTAEPRGRAKGVEWKLRSKVTAISRKFKTMFFNGQKRDYLLTHLAFAEQISKGKELCRLLQDQSLGWTRRRRLCLLPPREVCRVWPAQRRQRWPGRECDL